MTPGDPRIPNLFLLGFAGLVSWLLWRVVLRRARTAGEVRKLMPFFLVFGFFLLINALWSASSRTLWTRVAGQVPVVTRRGLESQRNQDQILLAGTVGSANRSDSKGIVYLVDNGSMTGPLELKVALQEGEAAVTGMDSATRWNWDTDFGVGRIPRSRLSVGQPVVVWGTVEHGQSMTQPPAAVLVSVRASLVFSGTAPDFLERARAQSARLYPRVLAWLSLALGLLVIGTPFAHWFRLRSAAAPKLP